MRCRWCAWSLVVVATVVGVAVFARGVGAIVRTVRVGRPAPGRCDARRPAAGDAAARGARARAVPAPPGGQGRALGRDGLVPGPVPHPGHRVRAGRRPGVRAAADRALRRRWSGRSRRSPGCRCSASSALDRAAAADPAARRQPEAEQRRSRFFGSNQAQAYFVEATVLRGRARACCVLRGLEYALAAQDRRRHLATRGTSRSPPGSARRGSGRRPATLETAIVVVATVKILVSMSWFVVVGLQPTMGVAWHRFLAVVNVYARREPDGAPGARPAAADARRRARPSTSRPSRTCPTTRASASARIEDFTWKGLLDFSTCTECGRCQDQCPAWATGKPLCPKLAHARAARPRRRDRPVPAGRRAPAAARPSRDPHAGIDLRRAPASSTPTPCGPAPCAARACSSARSTSSTSTRSSTCAATRCSWSRRSPPSSAATFTKLERQGNPWGLPARAAGSTGRRAWTFEVPGGRRRRRVRRRGRLPVLGRLRGRLRGPREPHDDPRRRRAAAHRRRAASRCSATASPAPATRPGAPATSCSSRCSRAPNVETLNEVGAQRIVVTCAHCFNTIAREYPQLGGRYEVVHHTELLDRLVARGPADPAAAPEAAEPHRDLPRPLLPGPAQPGLLPAARAARRAARRRSSPRCPATASSRSAAAAAARACGWRRRSAPASAPPAPTRPSPPGADVIATACPFCTVMLTDGVAASPAVGVPEVTDIALLLLDRVRE